LGKLTVLKLGNNADLSGCIPNSLLAINYDIDGTDIKTTNCP